MRGEALRTIGALTVLINSLSGVPGHKALLFVSDGISINPWRGALPGPAQELCSGSDNWHEGHASARAGAGDRTVGWPRRSGQLRKAEVPAGVPGRPRRPEVQPLQERFEDARRPCQCPPGDPLYAAGVRAAQASPRPARTADLRGAARSRRPPSSRSLTGQPPRARCIAPGRRHRRAGDARRQRLPPGARRGCRRTFESYYSLGYTPAHAGDGRDHKIEVKVKRRGSACATARATATSRRSRSGGPHARGALPRHRGQPAGDRGRDRRHRRRPRGGSTPCPSASRSPSSSWPS